MQLTEEQLKTQGSKQLAPKEIKKLALSNIAKSQKVNPQLIQNLKLVANQAQSRPAIVRRNSPNQG